MKEIRDFGLLLLIIFSNVFQNDAKTMSDEKNELVMINENLKNEKENLQGNSETLSDHVEKLNKQIEDLKKEIEKLKTVEETIAVKEV